MEQTTAPRLHPPGKSGKRRRPSQRRFVRTQTRLVNPTPNVDPDPYANCAADPRMIGHTDYLVDWKFGS